MGLAFILFSVIFVLLVVEQVDGQTVEAAHPTRTLPLS